MKHKTWYLEKVTYQTRSAISEENDGIMKVMCVCVCVCV
jgi:hypothetical protein